MKYNTATHWSKWRKSSLFHYTNVTMQRQTEEYWIFGVQMNLLSKLLCTSYLLHIQHESIVRTHYYLLQKPPEATDLDCKACVQIRLWLISTQFQEWVFRQWQRQQWNIRMIEQRVRQAGLQISGFLHKPGVLMYNETLAVGQAW